MGYEEVDKRKEKRTYIEPYDTGTFLEFTLGRGKYRFSLLDISTNGMGMLVLKKETKVLEKIKPGDQINMKFITLERTGLMDFKVKHITQIGRGAWKGHYQVGLSLVSRPT